MPAAKAEVKLNLYQKLQAARKEFSEIGVKKSGKNMSLQFLYFELADIVPVATQIFSKYGLLMVPTFGADIAVAEVYDCDAPEAKPIQFSAPFARIAPIVSNSGKAVTNEAQALGSSITYMRRYLWQLVLDIVEADEIDAMAGMDTPAPTPSHGPVTPAEREDIKAELTAAPKDAAGEDDIAALKSALKELLETDPEQESFVQTIALKTEGFKNLTKTQCDNLVTGVKEMLTGYTAQEG